MAIVDSSYIPVKSIMQLSTDTTTNWTSSNPIIPLGTMIYDSTTEMLYIGDGVKKFSELTPKIDKTLNATQKEYLDKAGTAGGVVILGEDGKVSADQLPVSVAGTVAYVNDISARDSLGEEYHQSLVLVLDASGDPTVTSGAALYGWDSTANENAGGWLKIAEYESLDIDFSVFFNKTSDTLDDITEGTTNVHFTQTLKTKLENEVLVKTNNLNLKGVNAADMLAVVSADS